MQSFIKKNSLKSTLTEEFFVKLNNLRFHVKGSILPFLNLFTGQNVLKKYFFSKINFWPKRVIFNPFVTRGWLKVTGQTNCRDEIFSAKLHIASEN